ncbi:MAG TPA: SdrD B-like domain-containing protein [Candidatus Absconditabacterales bacterium]|nr:SdrD B-like domain-containing protein [Candidatus Absconditabacterales bacterium]
MKILGIPNPSKVSESYPKNTENVSCTYIGFNGIQGPGGDPYKLLCLGSVQLYDPSCSVVIDKKNITIVDDNPESINVKCENSGSIAGTIIKVHPASGFSPLGPSWTNPQLFSLELCPQEYTFTCSINGKECENSAQTICKCNPKNTTKYNPNGYPTTCEPTCTEEQKQNNEQATCNRYRESDCSIQTKIKLCIEDIKKYSRKECQSNGTCQSVATDKDNNGKDLCDNDQQCKGEAKCGTKHYECNPGVAVQKTEEDTDDKTTRKWRCETTYKTNTGLEIKVIAPPDPLRCEETKLKGRKCNTTSFSCDESCILDPADPSSSCLNPLDCTQQCKPPKCLINPVGSISQTILPNKPLNPINITCSDTNNALGGIVTLNVSPLLLGLPKSSPPSPVQFTVDSNLISTVGTRIFNCSIKAGGITSDDCNFALTTTKEFGKCKTPIYTPNEELFRDDPKDITVTCQGDNTLDATIKVFEFSGGPLIIEGKHQVTFKGDKETKYFVECTHDTETTKDPNVCTVEVPVKKREFECPPDTDYPNIITNPNFGGLDRDEGPPWTVLVGTKLVGGDCVGNLIGSDKKPKKFQTLGIKGAPISFDSLGETTQYCLIEFEGKIRECPFRIKTVKPKCELILSQAGESNLDLKVDIKDEGGSLLPQKLIPNIKQAGDCSVSKLPGVVLNGSSPSFSATVGNNKLSIGTYDAKCFFQPPKFIECSNTTAITKPNGDGCKDQLQINGITPIDAINDNNIIKVDTPTINIKCGGTLKFVPPTAEKNYKDGVYTFETAKDEVVVICSVNNLECAGKFSGKKGGTTGEKETPKTGDNQCNNNNKVDAGEECDGTAIDACKTKDPKITDWKCESCKCVGSGDTNNPNNTGNSSGPTDGGPPDPNKEPKCIVKLEMVKEREFGTLKHIFDIGSVGMPRNQFELSCGLAVPSNGKDVWKVHVGDVVTNTYEGLGIGAYKAICWVRKKGGGSGDWIKCEDGPMSILPPGSDTCDDKIVVNPGTQISGYPAIRRTVPGSQATATCNGGKITYPPGGILDFTKQSSYDLICTMDKGYVCSAKAMGNNDPNNPNNSGKSGGGNSNGGGGGAGGGGPGGGGPSDGYPPIFTGDPNAPNDVMITKIPNRVFVADGDLINRSMIVKHLGSGIVNRYTIVDTFPSNQLDYKVMSLSGNSNILSYCGYPSGSWNYSLTGNQLSGSVTNAGFWSGMSCEFTLTTQVKSGIGTGKITNQVCVTGVNNELSGWLANNCSQNSVTVIKACPNLSVIPDFGDNPLTSTYQCILSGSNTGYIQILNAKDILIKSYTGVKGSHTFDKPGYYYVECISKQFTGERCIRPVEVRELSECLDLNIKAPNNISGSIGNYQALCTGTDLGASYQLRLRQGTTNVNVGTTGKLIQVINSRSGSLTIPSAGVYSIQCLINGLVDYHFEYTTGLNKNTVYTKDNCPYKKLPGGGLCAVDVQVAPLKITFTNPSQFKNTLDPIVYCPNELVANLSCDIYNNTPMMIKNYNRCIKPIIIDQPDMVINKTGNKLIYSAPDTISYTITYTNTGSMTVNSLTIQDTMSEFGSIKINSISQSSQSGYSLITKQSSSSGILFELTGSIPGKKGGRITLQGAIQTGSNVPVKNKVILNTPGDKYLANNISEYIVYPSGRNFSGGALGDRVWSDTNFNGIQNSGEQGIKNIKVELVGCTGNQNIKDTTYTDIFGNYHFDGVSSGYYRIATTLISGYVFTYGKVGTDDTIDSDITIGNTTNCFYYDGIKHNLNKDIGLYDIRNVVGAKFCNYNNRAEYKLGEECDGTDGVFGPNERCIACKLFKLFPNCGDGIVQQGEGCDCSTVLPSGSTCVDCQIVTGSVCGNGKLEGLEECETTSAKIKGLQCINCKIVVNELGQCGNGIVEVGEMCDMGIANGTAVTITGGRFQGKSCSENCNAVDNICRVISKKNTPECTQVLSPDIMEGEFLPFWWDITNNQIISNTTKCTMGKIPADSVKCHFELYNGKSGTTTSPITSFIVPCINPSLYDKPLLGGFNPLSASYAGRSMLQLTSKYTNGIYGEYKLQLTKIDYAICNNSGSTQSKTITSTDRVICEYNFTVSRPFLIQIGNSLASNQNDSLNNFYGFSSNTKKMNILEQYGIKLTPLTLTKFKPSSSLNYLINQFATKQTLLAQKAIEFGPQTSKIPGSNIFIYEGNTILDNQILPMNTSSTIIVRHGNLTLSGSLKPTNMYIVPEGDVIFAGGCTIDQTIYGIILTPNKLLSDIPYANNNLLNKRCSGGGLTIMGTMVGNGWEDLIAKRRSKLEGWFLGVDYRNKYQSIVNGGSVSIVANPLINITPPPGWNEFGKTVELIK